MNGSKLEHAAIETVARLAPWLAPLPSAFFVARASIRHLDAPLWMAIVIGAAIETLGLTANATALRLYEWNVNSVTDAGNLRKGHRLAPRLLVWLAAGTGALYLAVVIGLTVLLEVWPRLAIYALAAFPLFALTGTLLMAIRINQAKREQDAEKNKERRRRSRQGQLVDDMTDVRELVTDVPRWQNKDEFLADDDRPDDLDYRQLAQMTGKSERTARRWLKASENGDKRIIIE